MSLDLKNRCFGSSIADLWKEQERALKIIEDGTSNLLQVRNQMQRYVDDFELEKKVEPSYEECYHRKLEAKAQCIGFSISESNHFAKKVDAMASEIFSIISRPKITNENLRKLTLLNYDIEQIKLCQTALQEEIDFMKMRVEQIQLRASRFQTAAKSAQESLRLAQKKDGISEGNSWVSWFFGPQNFNLDVKQVAHIQEIAPPEDWMVRACNQPLRTFEQFSIADRFRGYLGVLLSIKELKGSSEELKEPIKKKTEKKVHFQDFSETEVLVEVSEKIEDREAPEQELKTQVEGLLPREEVNSPKDSSKQENEVQIKVKSLMPEDFLQDFVGWDVLLHLDNNENLSRVNIFSNQLQCLESMHRQTEDSINQIFRTFDSMINLLGEVTRNLGWSYNPNNVVTSNFQLQYFRARVDDAFAKYLEFQSNLDAVEMAITDYETALKKALLTLVDDETITTLKGFRFPVNLLKENQFTVNFLNVRIETFKELKKGLENAIGTLKRQLDLAVLAEKSALNLTSTAENFTYYFRREYIYFQEGLEKYKKKLERELEYSSEA